MRRRWLALLLVVLAALAGCSAGQGAPPLSAAPTAQAEATGVVAPTATAPEATPALLPQTSTSPVASTSVAGTEVPTGSPAQATSAPSPAPAPTATAGGPTTAAVAALALPPTTAPTLAVSAPSQPTATSTAIQQAQAPGQPPESVGLQLVAEGFTAPVTLVAPPDGSGRLFVVDQAGLIRIIGSDGKLLSDPFLDVRDRMVSLTPPYDERGLLGLAFHPDFAKNRRFFVFYAAPLRAGGPQGWDNTIHVSEFTVAQDNPDRADPGSERIILQVDEPQANHEGGTLAFGPDGYLYISLGDGGGANDTSAGHNPKIGNGQDLSTLLGKILRIDVNSQANGKPYAIPADNPFREGAAPEIYAFGFRNPYRFSIDAGGNHALYAADAGQNLFEEVDVVTKGGNYGWNIKEGTHCFDPGNPNNPPAQCPNTGPNGDALIDPIIEYSHRQVGIVDVGGYVYRGKAIPGLAGNYVFGDWSTSFNAPGGSLLVATPAKQGLWPLKKLRISTDANGRVGHYVLGFGQDSQGELYVLTSDRSGPAGNTGKVFKLVPGQ